MSEHYLDDKIYFRLVRKLAGSLGDVEAIKVELGRAGVWPVSVKRDLARSERLAEKARRRLARQAAVRRVESRRAGHVERIQF